MERRRKTQTLLYHIDWKCVCPKHPTFIPESDILIEDDSLDRLNDDHRALTLLYCIQVSTQHFVATAVDLTL